MGDTLANPAVQVNDIAIGIKPNSLTYKKGRGDTSVRAQSAGGDSIEAVVTEDAETKLSMCKFTVLTTKTSVSTVDSWFGQKNTIDLSDGSFTVPFSDMSVTTEPEVVTGADGEIEIEFQGPPVQ